VHWRRRTTMVTLIPLPSMEPHLPGESPGTVDDQLSMDLVQRPSRKRLGTPKWVQLQRGRRAEPPPRLSMARISRQTVAHPMLLSLTRDAR
jgi:hypothetical protein